MSTAHTSPIFLFFFFLKKRFLRQSSKPGSLYYNPFLIKNFYKTTNPRSPLLLTLFPLRYLSPLYHFGGREWEGVKLLPAPSFSRSTCLIHFKIGILPTISTSKVNQNGTLGHVTFLMKSSYFVKFSEILMKFQFKITFDVKNYFLILLQFLKENLLEISSNSCFLIVLY